MDQPEEAAAEVNALVAETTRGRIRDLVSPDSLNRGDAKIVLANAMYFKATWAERFDPTDTVHQDFHRLDGTDVRAPFLSACGMQFAGSFDDGPGFKVLRCRYKPAGSFHHPGPRFSMLVFLPHRRDGVRDLLRLAVAEQGFVTRHTPRQLQVVSPCMVPKFKFSYRFDAKDALCGLGLAAPFDPVAADLSGAVSNMPPMEGLFVSSVEQMCGVEVDEEGTTAAASFYSPSSPSYSPGQPSPPPPMNFVADHPFLFAIVEDGKGDILFLGHVMDPLVQ
jgi:serpin B